MNAIRRFLKARKQVRGRSSRFERYYGGVLTNGVGHPTADEARRDLRNYDESFYPYGWPR